MEISQLLIRLDAGDRFGLGHLSRCITLVKEFGCSMNRFLVRTDNEQLVYNFIKRNLEISFELTVLGENIGHDLDLLTIEQLSSKGTLLIVDHYHADELYQSRLRKLGIRWLQLDSHAKNGFYGDWVMHGSPGATEELYSSLRRRPETKFLLGPKYCIIKEGLRNSYNERFIRTKVTSVIICFGGGDDRGATLKTLEAIDFAAYSDVKFEVAVSEFNKDYNSILDFRNRGLVAVIPTDKLSSSMMEADLAIIAPGMLSYEAAFLGLPMLLVTLADNQEINSKAWELYGCALNVGGISEISTGLADLIKKMYDDGERLTEMSEICLSIVDGEGVKRIIEEIKR